MNKYFDDYIKHAALNFGQAAQGIRYFYSHPDIDGVSKKGTVAHCLKSMLLRFTIVINDLFLHYYHQPGIIHRKNWSQWVKFQFHSGFNMVIVPGVLQKRVK